MSANRSTSSSSEASAEGAGTTNTFLVNVNGRQVGIAESGQIVSGPPRMRGKWVAPSQLTDLQTKKDYHGHLLLSDKQEDTRLAEAELSLMLANGQTGEQFRPGMLFEMHGVEGRIEDISGNEVVVKFSGGANRRLPMSKLMRDAQIREAQTIERDEQLRLSEADLAALADAEIDTGTEEVALEAGDYAQQQCPSCDKHMLVKKMGGKQKCPGCGKYVSKLTEGNNDLSPELAQAIAKEVAELVAAQLTAGGKS